MPKVIYAGCWRGTSDPGELQHGSCVVSTQHSCAALSCHTDQDREEQTWVQIPSVSLCRRLHDPSRDILMPPMKSVNGVSFTHKMFLTDNEGLDE